MTIFALTGRHIPVSYTHLDVYKRQVQLRILWEAVLKWHKISGTPDQTLTCAYIGDIDVYKRQL